MQPVRLQDPYAMAAARTHRLTPTHLCTAHGWLPLLPRHEVLSPL